MVYPDRLIVVRGILGAGKSHLARKIAQRLTIAFNPEPIEEYEFLEKAYYDPKHFALKSQIDIFDKIAKITQYGGVMDQSLEDIVFVYSPLLLNETEQQLIKEKFVAYKLLAHWLPSPVLTVFLLPKPQEIYERILKRGRLMEQSITYEYIEQLSNLMNIEAGLYRENQKIILPSIDFANSNEALDEITHRVFANAV
jgi:deoxyguanosine kinase